MYRIFCVLLVVGLFAAPAGAVDLLVNGDFEQAGSLGSTQPGPMWQTNGQLEVIGPGGPEGLNPYSGQKCMGISAAGGVARSGFIGQSVKASPGVHTVTFSGRGWVYTPPNNPFRHSAVMLKLFVDDVQVRTEQLTWPPKEWTPIFLQWTGYVAGNIRVEAFAQAEGRGDPTGVAAFDGLSLDVSPPIDHPNWFPNWDFEDAGPVGSSDLGPGWFRTGTVTVEGAHPEWNNYDYAFAPTSGEKAAVTWTRGGVATGTVSGLKILTPGTYLLSLKMKFYLLDEYGAGDGTDINISLRVDGVEVKSQSFAAYVDVPQGQWNSIDWQWPGRVEQSVVLVMTMTSRGANNTLGIAAVDDVYLNAFDTSVPTAPVVVDDGEFTPSRMQLHASWHAEDPQTGIDNYQYSIGTSPGATNITNWMDVGPGEGVTKAGLPLVEGQTYYFNVRARNYQGHYGPASSSDGITVTSAETFTIGESKLLPDGAFVRFTDKILSQRRDSEIWAQERDGSAGIKVDSSILHQAFPNSRQELVGVMDTVDGQRVLRGADLTFSGQQQVAKAIHMNTRDLGGGPLGEHTPGVANGRGANNVGLMVTVTGRVTHIGDGFYYLDDGAALQDGSGHTGVRVEGPATGIGVGDMVRVTGVSSTWVDDAEEVERKVVTVRAAVKV